MRATVSAHGRIHGRRTDQRSDEKDIGSEYDEGRPSTPYDQLRGHLKWCVKEPPLPRPHSGNPRTLRGSHVEPGYADVVSVPHPTQDNPRARDFALRHVAGVDAPRCELRPGERRLKKRFRLDVPSDGSWIVLNKRQRSAEVREAVRRHRKKRFTV